MFDGLKDRLSDFRRDAEEEIDEATAEVEENEPADEPEPAESEVEPKSDAGSSAVVSVSSVVSRTPRAAAR